MLQRQKRYRDTEIWKYRNMQRYRDIEICRDMLRYVEVLGHNDIDYMDIDSRA